jgi:hypothetical protein
MTNQEIIAASQRLLRPYRIPETCPYLSEDQRELSLLDLKQRSAWMAEWLMLASARTPRLTRFRAPDTGGTR